VRVITVEEVMSPAPVVVRPEESLREVCRLMAERVFVCVRFHSRYRVGRPDLE